jgi:hypothetical protein
MKQIYQPHDLLFKFLLGIKNFLVYFLEFCLSQETLDILDLKTAKPINIDLVDANLINIRADLIITCLLKNRKKGDKPLIIVVEHLSAIDRYVSFYLSSIVEIIKSKQFNNFIGMEPSNPVEEKLGKLFEEPSHENSDTISEKNSVIEAGSEAQQEKSVGSFIIQPVMTIVFYCGSRQWDEGPQPLESFVLEGCSHISKNFLHIYSNFIDLNKYSENLLNYPINEKYYNGQVIKDEPLFRVVLKVMKAVTQGLNMEKLSDIVTMLGENKNDPNFGNIVPPLLGPYILTAIPSHKADEAKKIIIDTLSKFLRPDEVKSMFQTAADVIGEEYKIEGKIEGKPEMIIRILKKRFKDISESMEESLLKISDPDKLDNLVFIAATSDTLDDVESNF